MPCIFVLILVEVLKDALQSNFQQVEDRRLRAPVQDLPAVLLKFKADSTARKYEKGFDTWRKWASQFKEIVIFPASIVHVSLVFLSLIQESASYSTIDEVHYGLKWVHDSAALPDPCNSSLVLPLIESAERLLIIPVKKKEPATPEVIQLLFAKFGSSSASLSDLQVLTLCVLGYAGFIEVRLTFTMMGLGLLSLKLSSIHVLIY